MSEAVRIRRTPAKPLEFTFTGVSQAGTGVLRVLFVSGTVLFSEVKEDTT